MKGSLGLFLGETNPQSRQPNYFKGPLLLHPLAKLSTVDMQRQRPQKQSSQPNSTMIPEINFEDPKWSGYNNIFN